MSRHRDDDGNGIADFAEAHPHLGPDATISAPAPDPGAVHGVVEDGSTPVPVKAPGEPMRYRRDVRRDDLEGIVAETAHIIAHLSSIAAHDDNPHTNAEDVSVTVTEHPDGDVSWISIIGTLDATPSAPYLQPGYDPATDDDGTRFTRYSEAGRE